MILLASFSAAAAAMGSPSLHRVTTFPPPPPLCPATPPNRGETMPQNGDSGSNPGTMATKAVRAYSKGVRFKCFIDFIVKDKTTTPEKEGEQSRLQGNPTRGSVPPLPPDGVEVCRRGLGRLLARRGGPKGYFWPQIDGRTQILGRSLSRFMILRVGFGRMREVSPPIYVGGGNL